MMVSLPEEFVASILRVFGARGQTWLDALPSLLTCVLSRWELTLIAPVDDLSLNYVAEVETTAGKLAILKLGVLPHEVMQEAAALRAFAGRGIIRCLDADATLGALLLERVSPGHKLTVVGDNARETEIAAGIMRDLPVPCCDGAFPTFGDWLSRAFAGLRATRGTAAEPLGRRLVERAEAAFGEIAASTRGPMLLHGDLHHTNILFDDARGWLAIDPKGVLGDPILEVGRFLHNQLPDDPAAIRRCLIERVEIIAAVLGEDPGRIWRAAVVDMTLALAWSLEDAEITPDWYVSRTAAEAVAAMMG
jgi:streptomycin 6-kinase